ncbi:Methyltransferase, UbiE/COQ5 family [Sulfitobacter noctilucicola]|uniref:2-polyprenyl-3-methyl-5-hydroxy-6-metoxy-1, 4-benzoquinol methylase n=1 Tax=Sulfitobacter noctilucicola TaxID=1342301 RepID=A0A7W6M5V4_9RHOB|nr:class I SAM-dependent methyltransferase [Sulfitobacter noctilucicola]KIN62430.1 Methyltransferase, UbiE/COQ5 family [Sulfitobacter noctilucicola]MBB4173038.1 2-polyprenyl-3-methyl-5-hydroxy-6-metoxy-1,4-benzoquinol methylase [Sulfitobacter noctilucicola]
MKQTAEFWDKIADKYAASQIRDVEAYEYTLERTRSYLSAETRLLEIGCGTGSTALLLAEDVQAVTGSDISSQMVRIATEKAAAQDVTNVSFQVAGALDAVRGAKAYDVVTGFNVLHLTEGLDEILQTMAREMEQGSLFISKTPCLNDPSIGIKRFAFRALIPVMQFFRKAPFVQFLTFQELEALIIGAGLEIIETSNNPAMSRYIVARKP